jgi:hypothetical protein
MKTLLRPQVVTAAGVLVMLITTGITVACTGGRLNSSDAGNVTAVGKPNSKPIAGLCEQLNVPAYFTAPYWEEAIKSEHKPADMILNINGVGAGSAPDADLQYEVKRAQAAGITVLGYSSTADGQRPAAQVEADVRDYAAWYGVTSIFLDRVTGTAQQFSYYSQLAAYIHGANPGAKVWLNPGVYPADQNYMSIGDVVMVFEGTYAQYLDAQVPGWALSFPAGRFADTIYATPAPVLVTALNMAQERNATHVYVTDLVGSNPYQGLPSYWATEDADATVGCPGST